MAEKLSFKIAGNVYSREKSSSLYHLGQKEKRKMGRNEGRKEGKSKKERQGGIN